MTILPPPAPPTTPTAGTAPQLPASKYLRPWHVIGQMVTWAPTDQYAADRSMECGQASIVMALKHLTGVWTSAAYLDQLVHNPAVVQGTTLDEMVSTLAMMETRSSLMSPPTMAALRSVYEAELNLGHPLIVLRYWQFPGNALLHYACVTGYNASSIEIAGPGYGTMFDEPDDTHWSMYAGSIILIHRKRMLGDH